MTEISRFVDIIDMWPSAAVFGREIGVGDVYARAMRQRDSIPSKYWGSVVDAAKERGHQITFELLANIAAGKKCNRARKKCRRP